MNEWKYLPLQTPTSLRVLFFERGYNFHTAHFPDLLVGILPSGDTIRVLNKDTGKFSRYVKVKRKQYIHEPFICPGDIIAIEQDSSIASKLPLLATLKGIEGLHSVRCNLPGIIYFDSLTIQNTSICSIKNTYFVKVNFSLPKERMAK